MSGRSKVLWISDAPAPQSVRAAADGWEIVCCGVNEPLGPKLPAAGLALVCPNGAAEDPRRMSSILEELDRACVLAIFLLPPVSSAWKLLARSRGQILCIRQDAPAAELSAKLNAVAALQPAIGRLQAELATARDITARATGSMEELDEQIRLAARLQRDFLPRRLPEVGAVRFGVFYRPVSWVSGDIYDITRLDETHVGFYVADAIGHGMPAALLTMFIKKALQTKRIVGHTYQIIAPHVAMAGLNADICEQNLSSCQFCTAAYCVLDTAALKLSYCRAGHPEPILAHADGTVERLGCPGSLLGVFPDEVFESRELSLAGGDRLVLYTDGAEAALRQSAGEPSLEQILAKWAGLPREKMLLEVASRIDDAGSAKSSDDITVVVVDVEP